MTYEEFEQKFEDFMNREGLNNLSSMGEEKFFSSSRCPCCGGFPGDREKANGYNPKTGEIQEYEVCPDCLYYAAYGILPDF